MTVINLLGICSAGVVAASLLLVPVHSPERLAALVPIRWFGLGLITFNVAAPLYLMLSNDPVTHDRAFIAMLLGGGVAGVGYLGGWAGGLRRPLVRRCQVRPSVIPAKPLAVLGTLAVALGMLGTGMFVFKSGGVFDFWATKHGKLDMIGPGLYNVVCLLVAQYVVGMGVLASLAKRAQRKEALFAVLAVVGILFVLSSMKLGSRTRMLFGALSLVYFLGLVNTRKKAIVWLVVGVSVLPLAVRYGSIRSEGLSLKESLTALVFPGELAHRSSLSHVFGSAEFDAFENGVYLTDVVSRTGAFFYGSSFLTALINPIPRLVWATKPVVDVVAPMRQATVGKGAIDNANIAVSLVAECYVNLWWPGVFFIPSLLGYLAARIWQTVCTSGTNVFTALLLVALCVFSLVVCRGSFAIIFTMSLMVALLPILAMSERYLVARLTARLSGKFPRRVRRPSRRCFVHAQYPDPAEKA